LLKLLLTRLIDEELMLLLLLMLVHVVGAAQFGITDVQHAAGALPARLCTRA